MRLQRFVQPVKDDARLDVHRHRRAIEGADAIEIFAVVDDERGTHRLAALRAAGAAREHRHAHVATHVECHPHVVVRARDQHAERLDLVDRGVGCVAPARCGVEQDLAGDRLAQSGGEIAAFALRVKNERLRERRVHGDRDRRK